MENVQGAIDVAKGISDYGALAMIGAVYILLTAAMMITSFKWFKSIVERIIKQQEEIKPILGAIKENGMLMRNIAEDLRPETEMRIRNLTGFAFDLSVEQVCRLIKKIRTENHIADREATSKKIRKSLTVLHNDRNSKFDSFTYHGEKLSAYCSDEWVENVAKVVEAEIYHADGANNGRAFTNVKLAYDDIKTDFYKNMTN